MSIYSRRQLLKLAGAAVVSLTISKDVTIAHGTDSQEEHILSVDELVKYYLNPLPTVDFAHHYMNRYEQLS